MNMNFLARYEKDSSDSSDSDDNLPKNSYRISLTPSHTEPSPVSQQRMAITPRTNTIAPYTFDPKSVLDNPFGIEHKNSGSKSLKGDPVKHEEKLTRSIGTKKLLKVRLRLERAVSFNFPDDDPLECKRTDEYKKFLKIFDKNTATAQEALMKLTDRLISCLKKLETITNQLNNNHFDPSLFRKHLQTEIGSVKNEIKDANNDSIIISEERKSLRDKYCVLQTANEFLKNSKKVKQDEVIT